MTECSPLITSAGPVTRFEGPKANLFKSTGVAVPGVEVKIIDENDNEVPRGEVGEVAARGLVSWLLEAKELVTKLY